MDFKTLLKNKWLLAMAAFGVLLLLVGTYLPKKVATPTTSSPSTSSLTGMSGGTSAGSTGADSTQSTSTNSQYISAQEIESDYDKELQEILSSIQGIHAVSVMVTVDSSGTLSVAENSTKTTTESGNGSGKTSTVTKQVYTSPNSSQSGPFVLSNQEPQVRGVLVTVNADDFSVAKLEIVESITNVLDVPAYKISVEPQ